MKCINMTGYNIVKAGLACISETPIRLDNLLSMMERNEAYIFWLQPQGADVDAQIPAISINGKFYHPNLRLEKDFFPARPPLARLQQHRAAGGRHAEAAHSGAPDAGEGQEFHPLSGCPPSHVSDLSASKARVLKVPVLFQGMPQKPSTHKPKRAVARGVGKDTSKIKINRPQLLRNHQDVRMDMMQAEAVGVSLVLSPRALVLSMQRSFEEEFPLLAGRARFSLDAE